MSIERPGLEDLDPGSVVDGSYVVTVVDGVIVSLDPVPPTGVQTIVAGQYVTIDDSDPLNVIVNAMVPLTTLNSSGIPEIVFDSDGRIIYTEEP